MTALETPLRRTRNRGAISILALLLAASQLLAQQLPANDQPASAVPNPVSPQQSVPQQPAPVPASSSPSTPTFTGPLQPPPSIAFDAGVLGKLNLDGMFSAIGLWQGNHIPSDEASHPAVNNGFLFLQKASGPVQFYIQAGAYNVVSLGAPFVNTGRQVTDLWGPIPVAYLKFSPTKTTSIQVGSLPTLMGAEYTFDPQNMNIQRGLLWNQENAINRGIQINQTLGKVTASFSWNDGFFSNRYSWLSGSVTYTNSPTAYPSRLWEIWARPHSRLWRHRFKTTAACTPWCTATPKANGSCSPICNTAMSQPTQKSTSPRGPQHLEKHCY